MPKQAACAQPARPPRLLAALLGSTAALAAPPPALAGKLAVLHSFTAAEGTQPSGRLAVDAAGHIYGVTSSGGPANCGAVYRLSPPASPGQAWTFSVLHGFTASDGSPTVFTGLTLAADGALYGATTKRIFRVSLGAHPAYSNIVNLVAQGYRSFYPSATPRMGADGALYGTSVLGDAGALGFAYRVARGSTGWVFTQIHSFGGPEGWEPKGDLTLDSDGSLIGTDQVGTSGNASTSWGSIYRLSPPAAAGGAWTASVLHDFAFREGNMPVSGVAAGAGGVFYGSTSVYKNQPRGWLFAMAPGPGGYTVTDLVRNPIGDYASSLPLVQGDGSLWAANGSTVMRASQSGLVWSVTRLTSFNDGAYLNQLAAAPDGGAYFTADYGRNSPGGRVYHLAP